jgi:hypothetical protein
MNLIVGLNEYYGLVNGQGLLASLAARLNEPGGFDLSVAISVVGRCVIQCIGS